MVNRQDENPGKIHELVNGTEDCRLVYAVLSIGGFLGMGSELFAIPLKAFKFHATDHNLILNVEKEKMKNAPGFERDDKGPDFSDTLWGESIYNNYDYVPSESRRIDDSGRLSNRSSRSTVPCHARGQSKHLFREGGIPGFSNFSGLPRSRGRHES